MPVSAVGQRLLLHVLEFLLELADLVGGAGQALLERAVALGHALRLVDEIGDEAADLGRLAVAERDREIVERPAELGGVAGRGVEMLFHLIDDEIEPAAGLLQQIDLAGLVEEAAEEVAVDLGREVLAVGQDAVDGGGQLGRGAERVGVPDGVVARPRRHGVVGHRFEGGLAELRRRYQFLGTVHGLVPDFLPARRRRVTPFARRAKAGAAPKLPACGYKRRCVNVSPTIPTNCRKSGGNPGNFSRRLG